MHLLLMAQAASLEVHSALVGPTNKLWWLPTSIGLTIGALVALRHWRLWPKRRLFTVSGACVATGAVLAAVVHLFVPEIEVNLTWAQVLGSIYGLESALVLGQIAWLLAAANPKPVRAGITLLAASLTFLVVDRLVLQYNYDKLSGDSQTYYVVQSLSSPKLFFAIHIGIKPYYLVGRSEPTSLQTFPTTTEPQALRDPNTAQMNMPACDGQVDFTLITEDAFDQATVRNVSLMIPPSPRDPASIWRWMLSPKQSGRQEMEFVGTLTEKAGRPGCVAKKRDIFFDGVEQVSVWSQWFELDQSPKIIALLTSILAVFSTILGLLIPKRQPPGARPGG